MTATHLQQAPLLRHLVMMCLPLMTALERGLDANDGQSADHGRGEHGQLHAAFCKEGGLRMGRRKEEGRGRCQIEDGMK